MGVLLVKVGFLLAHFRPPRVKSRPGGCFSLTVPIWDKITFPHFGQEKSNMFPTPVYVEPASRSVEPVYQAGLILGNEESR